jgi:hypothetical protein
LGQEETDDAKEDGTEKMKGGERLENQGRRQRAGRQKMIKETGARAPFFDFGPFSVALFIFLGPVC